MEVFHIKILNQNLKLHISINITIRQETKISSFVTLILSFSHKLSNKTFSDLFQDLPDIFTRLILILET